MYDGTECRIDYRYNKIILSVGFIFIVGNRKITRDRNDDRQKKRDKNQRWNGTNYTYYFHFEVAITGPDFWFIELETVVPELVDGGGTTVGGPPLPLLLLPPALPAL